MNKIALRLSPVALVIALVLFIVDMPTLAGPLLVFTFALAAYGVRSHEKLRGISFSLLIFAAVVFALCYPAPLVSWGEFKLSTLITPLLQLIMFGMGVSMSLTDFASVGIHLAKAEAKAREDPGVGIGHPVVGGFE